MPARHEFTTSTTPAAVSWRFAGVFALGESPHAHHRSARIWHTGCKPSGQLNLRDASDDVLQTKRPRRSRLRRHRRARRRSPSSAARSRLLTLPAFAQPPSPAAQVSGEFERPFGYGYGEEQSVLRRQHARRQRQPRHPRWPHHDGHGPVLAVHQLGFGRRLGAGHRGAGFGAGIATGTAVGNQLNVITQGNWNTVIVNSTQINNGNQTTVLNGKIDLQ